MVPTWASPATLLPEHVFHLKHNHSHTRVLITGVAGFIGGHIAESFVKSGHNVTTLKILEPFYDIGLKKHNINAAYRATETNGSYEFIEDSIPDTRLVDDIMEDIDVVYHQAAQAGVRVSVEEPVKATEYNINGSQTILEAARKHDVQRGINASSSSVYGKPQYLPYDEDHPNEPVSPYGASKLVVEHYMYVNIDGYGLPTVLLHYFTIYGPRPNMATSNFVSRSPLTGRNQCCRGHPSDS